MPYRSIDILHITYDDAKYFLGHIVRVVVCYELEGAFALSGMGFDHLDGSDDVVRFETAHDDGAFVHAFRTLVGLANGNRREIQDRRFLGDGAAVGDDTGGGLLQLYVIVKS